MQDLRLAFRTLRATPIVSIVAILSLALGIGANTAIFSLVNSLLLRTLPVVDPQRLAILSVAPAPSVRPVYSYSTFDQIRQHDQAFDGALAYNCCGKSPMTIGRETELIDRVWVSGDFFATLGVPALLGRPLTPADDVRGGGPDGPTVVISYGLWQRRFGGAANVIGMRIVIERVLVSIVGVTPPDFLGVEVGRTFDVALPLRMEPLILPAIALDDDMEFLSIMLRLKSGQSLTAATAALRAVQPQIRAASLPRDGHATGFLTSPFALERAGTGISTLRQRFEQPLVAILIVVALVLLIACANIANLQLARGTARRHELSLRLALGASRWRLARQLVMESVVLASIGTMIGFVFARWASRFIVAQLSTSVTPVVLDLSLDSRVLVFTAATTASTALLFGVVPALRATRLAPMDALKEHDRGAAGGTQSHLSNGLIVAQAALSLVLLVAAGLFVRTFDRLAQVPLGFDPDRVLLVTVTAPTVPAADRNPFYHRLVRAAAVVPGVAQAGGSLNPPPLQDPAQDQLIVTVPGADRQPDAERMARAKFMTPGWLAAYGTVMHTGRDIDDHDTAATRSVMVVNEVFAHRFFPSGNALGATVAMTYRLSQIGDLAVGSKTVVGVVSDAVFSSLREPVPPAMYFPIAQREGPIFLTNFYIGVRASSGSPALLTRALTTALMALNPDLLLAFRPLRDQVNASLAQDRLVAILAGFFGGLALLLAALGLYGVTSYAVARRRIEIGIRMALGAAPSGIARLVLSRVSLLVGLGVVAGVGVSLLTSTFVAPLLYGLDSRDPVTLVGAVITLAAVATFAGWLPAWRASRIDPAEVLRES